jgi:hypothetical protein
LKQLRRHRAAFGCDLGVDAVEAGLEFGQQRRAVGGAVEAVALAEGLEEVVALAVEDVLALDPAAQEWRDVGAGAGGEKLGHELAGGGGEIEDDGGAVPEATLALDVEGGLMERRASRLLGARLVHGLLQESLGQLEPALGVHGSA